MKGLPRANNIIRAIIICHTTLRLSSLGDACERESILSERKLRMCPRRQDEDYSSGVKHGMKDVFPYNLGRVGSVKESKQ